MKLLFRFVFCYLVFAIVLMAMIRPAGADLGLQTIAATIGFGKQVANATVRSVPFLLIAALVVGWRRFSGKLGLFGYAVLASVLLQVAFSFLKSSIPLFVPFYADEAFATFDRWLHGGHDPWELVHRWTEGLPVHLLFPAYIWVWTIPAAGFAGIIALTDQDRERTARFLVLYMSCWLILGNVFAIAGASVGPVYYDALLGGDRFRALHGALESSGVATGLIGLVQDKLWEAYAGRSMALGLGISAFPSVHVGIATLAALYMGERSRWLILPGVLFLAVIMFLSVYTGYHYAVDGYFSILFVTGGWLALRRMRLTEMRWPGLRAPAEQVPATPG